MVRWVVEPFDDSPDLPRGAIAGAEPLFQHLCEALHVACVHLRRVKFDIRRRRATPRVRFLPGAVLSEILGEQVVVAQR